jgi:thioredoxin 1
MCECSQGTDQWLVFLYLGAAMAVFMVLEIIPRRKRMESNGSNAKGGSSRSAVGMKVAIIIVLVFAVGAALYMKGQKPAPVAPNSVPTDAKPVETRSETAASAKPADTEPKGALPRLVDLGAGKCIPCKMMAPILDELKKEYAGKIAVQFIDVWKNPGASEQYGIQVIPTQIFFDASGKERFRHEGFFSKEDILAKWQELGVDLSGSAPAANAPESFSRLEPAVPDTRPRESICYMCDGDVNPKTRTVLKTEKGDVVFCSPHCYFIAYSSMVDPKGVHENVFVTDWATGAPIPAVSAKYVYGMDADNRPTIKAFGDQNAAASDQQASGGNIVEWAALQGKELTTRCGFCDRAVYPEDACAVKVEGLDTWGCCTMCALGVAARMQKDIEVAAKDALTGEPIRVKTTGGHVSSLEPQTAVAWAGTKKDAEGQLVSTGCFKQAFFCTEANLRKWVDGHPTATGRMISIEQALAEKMKLTSEQISKACKIGECVPK